MKFCEQKFPLMQYIDLTSSSIYRHYQFHNHHSVASLRLVHTLFQSEFSTKCDVVLPL